MTEDITEKTEQATSSALSFSSKVTNFIVRTPFSWPYLVLLTSQRPSCKYHWHMNLGIKFLTWMFGGYIQVIAGVLVWRWEWLTKDGLNEECGKMGVVWWALAPTDFDLHQSLNFNESVSHQKCNEILYTEFLLCKEDTIQWKVSVGSGTWERHGIGGN